MTRALSRLAVAVCTAATMLTASAAFAQATNTAPKIDAADTAWMISATGLVLMMTIPGLALFYARMVRKKNMLATMAQSLAATFLVSILMGGYRLQPRLHRRRRLNRHARSHLSARHDARCDLAAGQDHPRKPVHDLSDDLRHHHGGAGRGFGRGLTALLRVSAVLHILAAAGLCADRTLGLGRRLPWHLWLDRFRRRHRGTSQCRHRRSGRGLCGGRTPPAVFRSGARPRIFIHRISRIALLRPTGTAFDSIPAVMPAKQASGARLSGTARTA